MCLPGIKTEAALNPIDYKGAQGPTSPSTPR